MKICKEKLCIAQARSCMTTNDLIESGIPRGTLMGILTCQVKNVRPSTVGKIAKVLGVDVTEIIED